MVRRGTDEPVSDHVDESERQPAGLEGNLDTVHRRRLGLGDGQHAHRNKWAILAAIALLSVWTAWHIAGHRGHIGLSGSQALRRRWRHQRSKDEPDDHEDRKQTTAESAKIHVSPSHGTRTL
jgi:hypothetical protein